VDKLIKAKNIGQDTPLDRILRAHIEHKLDQLSESDKKILERITEADNRLKEGQIVKKTVNKKIHVFNRPIRYKELVEWLVEKFGISHRQAYVDIAMAKQFFLSVEGREDKEFARGQMILQGEEFMHLAVSMGDFKSAAAFFRELAKIRGLDRVDPETMNADLLQPTELIIVDDPSELGFEKIDNPDDVVNKLKQSFKKNILDAVTDDAEEVDFEEG
jgi:hypothetical protein